MKIYIAGPNVFHVDSNEKFLELKSLCEKYNHIALTPKDSLDFTSKNVYNSNIQLIKECDIVIADLRDWRGFEPDSGTVWECGYAYGLSKKVYGYTKKREYKDRILKKTKYNFEPIHSKQYWHEGKDWYGHKIEDFGYTVNLMLEHSIVNFIGGSFEDVLKGIENV